MRTYTTAEVGRIVGVCHLTIRRWLDTGLLAGYRIPGPRRDRRITHAALVAFMKRHELPLELLPESKEGKIKHG